MAYKLEPNYDVLKRLDAWDKETQEIIKDRLSKELNEDEFSFLTDKEGKLLEQLVEVLLPQPEGQPSIKIAQVISQKLSKKKEGLRYEANPWKGEFYKKGLKELLSLRQINQEKVQEIFDALQGDFLKRFIRQVLEDSVVVYYAHPNSWNQIGFPGPAFPEGYAYLACGEKDTWEPEYQKDE